MKASSLRQAFTLVELLVVMAIIATLIGLLLPAVQKVRESGNRTKCVNNMKQLGLALNSYQDKYGRYPQPTYTGSAASLSWQAMILSFIEQEALWKTVLPGAPAYGTSSTANPTNVALGAVSIPTFLCPSYNVAVSSSTDDAPSTGVFAHTTHYVGNAGPIGTNPKTSTAYPVNSTPQGGLATSGVLPYYPSLYPSPLPSTPIAPLAIKIGDISDGTSNTLMIFELAWNGLEKSPGALTAWQRGTAWQEKSAGVRNVMNPMYPAPGHVAYNGTSNFNNVSMGSNHLGGSNIVLADGSVRFLRSSIDMPTLLSLASRNGGEQVNLD